MNISKIVKKVLLEDDNVKGIDWNDQYSVLNAANNYCPAYKEIIGDKEITLLKPELKSLFPELKNYQDVAKITHETPEKTKYVLFGIVDKNAKVGEKRALLGYQIKVGQTPQRFINGWGSKCDQLQDTIVLGQDQLPQEFQQILDDFITKNPSYVSKFKASEEFEKVNYKDLTYPNSDRKVLQGYEGPGYIWVHTKLRGGDIDVYSGLDNMLKNNNLTKDTPKNVESNEFNFPISLSVIAGDLPGLEKYKNLDTSTVIYPVEGTLIEPSKEVCRTVINKLYDCTNSTTGLGCRDKLFAKKVTALMCSDLRMVEKGRLQDEFGSLIQDGGDFGLRELNRARAEGLKLQSNATNESVSFTVSKFLNEEFKRRNS